MASFVTSNIPSDTTMIDFRANLDKLGSAAHGCRFAVRILPSGTDNFLTQLGYSGILRDMTYLCEAVEFPGRGFDFIETRYYGPIAQRPYNPKYSGEFSMTLLTRQEAFERQMFDDWLEVINPTNTFDFSYPEFYECSIDVFQLSDYPESSGGAPRKGKASYLWQIQNAWPIQVNPQQVTWADNDVLRLNISFAYRHWIRPGRDSTPNTQALGTLTQENL